MAKARKSKRSQKNKMSGSKKIKKNKGYRDPGKKRTTGFGKDETKVPDNPFEIRVNKQKHDNLGRSQKHERGVPGISRDKAIQKRKQTLLVEYASRTKTNVMKDKRIGERNKLLSEDDKRVQRSAVEKAIRYKKKSMFNLPDEDEMLTHKGVPLLNMERYDDPRDNSDSEDERLDEEYVGEAHFSGFMKFKKDSEGLNGEAMEEDDNDGSPNKKSRDEIIAELITSSKKRKLDKMKETEENIEAINKLDDIFKDSDMRALVLGVRTVTGEANKETVGPPITSEPEKDNYDRLVKELGLAAKAGRASDPLKSEEQNAAAAKEAFVKMEKSERELIMTCLEALSRKPVFKENDLKELNRVLFRCAKLYDTTESKHFILSPAICLVLRLIQQHKLKSLQNVLDLLYWTQILYEFSVESKLYNSEVLRSLGSLLSCFIPNSNVDKHVTPSMTEAVAFLRINDVSRFVDEDYSKISQRLENIREIINEPPDSVAKHKHIVLLLALCITRDYIQLYSSGDCPQEVSCKLIAIIQTMKDSMLYKIEPVAYEIDAILSIGDNMTSSKEVIFTSREKPKGLKFYEPLIEENFDAGRRKKGNKNTQELEKLKRLHKKEMKSAIREVKKDNMFLAKKQMEEQRQMDAERLGKVKSLMASLANQEGDYQKLERIKNKKH